MAEDSNNVDIKWLDKLFELCGEKDGKTISDFYNVIFFQLKTNVFTLLAPVNLKDEEKMKEFYRHKFSLGYVYGLIITLLQSADFMKENEKKLHEMLTVALMKQLFNFKGGDAYFDNYPKILDLYKIKRKIDLKFKTFRG